MLSSIGAFSQNKPEIKMYGFVRTFSTVDTRLSKSGTGELYYYVPLDHNYNANGEDLNALTTAKTAALTSRLGINTSWKSGSISVKGKIEADFYSGLSGITGTAAFRLRQAYFDILTPYSDIRMGQAWHPMAADMPDVIALEVGVPFGPFSRTPQLTVNTDWGTDCFYTTVSLLTQMQYTSAGPEGNSANYAKYTGFIKENGGEIVYEEDWGLRQLAYPIKKRTSGFYYLIEFKAETSLVASLETQYRRDERIIRFLTFAMDKHAVAYAEKRRANKAAKKEE